MSTPSDVTSSRPRNGTAVSRVVFPPTPRTPPSIRSTQQILYREHSMSASLEHVTFDENESRRRGHRYDQTNTTTTEFEYSSQANDTSLSKSKTVTSRTQLPEIVDAMISPSKEIIVVRDQESNRHHSLVERDDEDADDVDGDDDDEVDDDDDETTVVTITTATSVNEVAQLADFEMLGRARWHAESDDIDFDFLIDTMSANVMETDKVDVLSTMRCIAENLLSGEEKYRLIWVDNHLIQKRVLKYDGGYEFLNSLGFDLVENQLVCGAFDERLVRHAILCLNGKIVAIQNAQTRGRPRKSTGKGTTNFDVTDVIPTRLLDSDDDDDDEDDDENGGEVVLIHASPCHTPPPFVRKFRSVDTMDDEESKQSATSDINVFIYGEKGRTRSNGTISLAEIGPNGRRSSVQRPLFTEASRSSMSHPSSLLGPDLEAPPKLEDVDIDTPLGPAPVQSLDSLIIEMTNRSDSKLVDALLLCHQEDTTSVELIRTLRRQFRVPVSLEDEDVDENQLQFSIRAKIVALIRNWIKNYYPEDFDANKELSQELQYFLDDVTEFTGNDKRAVLLRQNIETSLLNQQRQLAINAQRQASRYSQSSSFVSTESRSSTGRHSVAISRENLSSRSDEEKASISRPTPGGPLSAPISAMIGAASSPRNNLPDHQAKGALLDGMFDNIEMRYAILHLTPDTSTQQLTQISAETLAEQLTLMDFNLFVHIRAREFLHQGWKAADKYERAPNILRMIAHFNSVARWVQVTILSAPNVRQRAIKIRCMIDIASSLRRLRNYSSLCAVHGALSSFDIQCLKLAWQRIPANEMKTYQQLSEIFSWRGGKIKELQDQAAAPAVPHIGIILSELHSIEEKAKAQQNGKKGVNREKMCKLHVRVSQLQIFQQGGYRDVEAVPSVQQMFLRDFKQQVLLTGENIQSISDCVRQADTRNHK